MTPAGRCFSASMFDNVPSVNERLLTRATKNRKVMPGIGSLEKKKATLLKRVTVPINVNVVHAVLQPRWAETL